MLGNYRYTVRVNGGNEKHAAMNLYESWTQKGKYVGGTICHSKGTLELVDGPPSCVLCRKILTEQSKRSR